MPSNPWVWDDGSKRYRNTATGRFLGPKQMLELRDQFLDAKKAEMSVLTDRLVDGDLNAAQWTQEMRRQIRTTYVDEYVLARGGRGNMTQADWGRIGQMVKGQYQFLGKFEQDIKAGKLSPGQITTRANMYVESGTQAFEQGKAVALGLPRLPAYPGDGSTLCKANCRCHWEIEAAETEWLATWTLGIAEHCDTCVQRAQDWAPYRVRK